MTEVIFDHGGTLDKFIGDGVLGFFGAPVHFEEAELLERAVDCASAMRRALQGFNVLWEMENLPQIKMRIGLHFGDVIVGNFGTIARNDYGILVKPLSKPTGSRNGAIPTKYWSLNPLSNLSAASLRAGN